MTRTNTEMKNVSIERRVTATINLTPDQWALYSSMEGVDVACEELNRAAEAAVAAARDPSQAMTLIYPTLRKWQEMGALDTEPLWTASALFNECFYGATRHEDN